MKTKNALIRIEQYLGIAVSVINGVCEFTYDGKVCRFRDSDGDAYNFHIRNMTDHSDPQSDYFAGYFLPNCTQFLHSLKRPPPKYPPGSLVRGKANKRAKRWGFAGKVGVVVDYCKYGSYEVLWNGSGEISGALHGRDLEGV